jgi:hypothetical protein
LNRTEPSAETSGRNASAAGKEAGGVFTSYLRSLDPHGQPPGEAEFDAVWQALRSALYAELRRRGLWHLMKLAQVRDSSRPATASHR